MRILLCFCGFLLALSASGKELFLSFANDAEGSSPTNFHAALAGSGSPGRWKIVLDDVPQAPTLLTSNAPPVRCGVLAQTGEDMSDEHFPMFIYDGDIFHDFKFSTRFKIVSGITEQMAGIVFRYQNSSNFYVLRVSSLGRNVGYYKVVNGVRADNPHGPPIYIPPGQWHSLGVQCEGDKINVSLDDQMLFQVIDSTFPEGKIGFWTKSDAISYFADAFVDYTPRIPAAQEMINNVMEKQPRVLGLRIYTLQTSNTTAIIASKDLGEIGRPGTAAELKAITDGATSYGTETGAVLVTLPLRDRNGDYIGAVRVKLKSYFTETQDAAVLRAEKIRSLVEELCTTVADLQK